MRTFFVNLCRSTIFAWLSWVNKKINHNPHKILFYSDLGFRDNVKALYDYVIENNYNKKYQIICATNDYVKYKDVHIENVTFTKKLRGFGHYFSAGYVFYCFGKIPFLPGKNQQVIQLWHGSPLKAPSKDMLANYSSDKLFFTHIIASSKVFADILSQWFTFPVEKISICGQPRNDLLFKNYSYDFGEYKKLILWVPTFRTSKQMGTDSNQSHLVPIFKETDFEKLNTFLKEIGVKLIVKLHPVQNLTNYQSVELENFILLSNDEFQQRNMDLYLLCSQADAMITDYSSIYFDYLLVNRPIAFTEDDITNYSENRGFSIKNQNESKPGFRIKTQDDFFKFITDVANSKDEFENERLQVNSWANTYVDNQSSIRVLKEVGITIED